MSAAGGSGWHAFKSNGEHLLPRDAIRVVPRLDPYLMWLEATGYLDVDTVGSGKRQVSIIAELDHEASHGQLPPAMRSRVDWFAGKTRFVSGVADIHFFDALSASLKGIVKRVELSQAIRSARTEDPAGGAVRASTSSGTLKRFEELQRSIDGALLVGVIDNGCPFAHQSLRRQPNVVGTRVAALWDQGLDRGPGSRPGYGRAFTGRFLDAVTRAHSTGGGIDEAGMYRALEMPSLEPRASHGAHVLDTFAGPVPLRNRTASQPDETPTWARETRGAAVAPIVFVQIPRGAVQDNSGRWLGRHVLNGLRFIAHAGRHCTRIIANVSYGPQTGPHDGSSILEQSIDELVGSYDTGVRRARHFHVVVPAGNSFDAQGYATFDLPPMSRQVIDWRVPPNCEAPSFLEVWLPGGATESIAVRVTPPGATVSPAIRSGKTSCLRDGHGVQAVVVFPPHAANGEHGTLVLVALSPTFSYASDRSPALHGAWAIEIENESAAAVNGVAAYVARNDLNFGAKLRARPAHLEDPAYDTERYLRPAQDDIAAASTVRRRGSLSGIATGTKTQVVAGYRWRDQAHAPYSSAGPTRSGLTPVASCPSDESTSMRGVRAAGNFSGGTVRLVGTSVSAPQWARALATGLPKLPSPGDPQLFGSHGKKLLQPP